MVDRSAVINDSIGLTLPLSAAGPQRAPGAAAVSPSLLDLNHVPTPPRAENRARSHAGRGCPASLKERER